MQYEYTIEYKKGRENIATDALSRAPSLQVYNITMVVLHSKLMARIEKCWKSNTYLQKNIFAKEHNS